MSKAPDPTTLQDLEANGSPNGSPFPNPLAPQTEGKRAGPRAMPERERRRSRLWLWVALALLVLVAGDVLAHFVLGKSLATGMVLGQRQADRPDVILHTVKKEPLAVTVIEKGQLESADNKDIVCKVRAGNKGYATTITWVIDDGTRVKPGQLIMILEDSALRDQEEAQDIVVRTKLSEKITAEKAYEIQIKKNESAIALAQTALVLAEIDLDKLTGLSADPALMPLAAVASAPTSLVEGGAYRQDLDNLTGKISLAASDVEQNRERAAWADRMVKQSYMSAAQAQAEKSRLDSSVENLRSLQSQKALLISHDRRQRITDLTSKRDNAMRALDQAKLEAEATEVQARTDKQTKTAIYEKNLDTLEDLKKQRAECKIHAPDDIEDGSMVVYFKAEANRFGGSSSQALIEAGAQVKEGQKMLRIPNLSKMQVNTKVHEAMVARVKGEVRVPTKIAEGMQIGLLSNLDLYGRMVATQAPVLENLREQYRRYEYRKVAEGQRAMVRLNSVSDKKFVGHVKTVAGIASQADMMMSDVKVYQTFVRVDGELAADGKSVTPLEGELLKPDMTAEVTISVDAAQGPVLTAPIQAIIGGAEMGTTREVFVKTETGFERKPVRLGLYNEKMVEIREGLEEGDEIVTNPKVLLGDKDKTKTREPGDFRNNDTKGGPGGEKGGKGSGGGKGAGGGGKGMGGSPGGGGPPTS